MSILATSSLWTPIAIPSAAVLGAIVTMTLTRVNEATNRRRDRYAEAIQTLVAWTEYPYRVRRRADDTPATLTALANRGHDLQERLALHEAWIATEHPALAQTYAATRATLDRLAGPLISEAWDHRPTGKASAMNLRGWGPSDECRDAIAEVQREIQNRFGYRRFARWIGRWSLGSPRANSGREQSHRDRIEEMPQIRSGADAKARSLSVDDGAPYWFRILFLAVIAAGSLAAAIYIGMARFGNLNAALASLISLGSIWGLGAGLWSLVRSFGRLLKKAEPSFEKFADWAPSVVWKQFPRVRKFMTLRSRRDVSQDPPVPSAG
ncbi:MAG: hypothetical protein OXI26_08060 [bacterium]|nr:hypothetical protein [bacterium]